MEPNHKKLTLTDRNRLESIKEYIRNNPAEELSVLILAERFMLSKSTLKRQFYFFYKQSVSRFILQIRMQAAYMLLKEQDIPVSNIGNYVGYKDRSAFTHAFTKYFGYPPIQLFNAVEGDIYNRLNEPNNHKNEPFAHKNEPNNHT